MGKTKAIIVEGRCTCEHCDLDKFWVMSIDWGKSNRRGMEAIIKNVANRQREEVIDKSYPQPPHKLNHQIKYNIDKFVELDLPPRGKSRLEKALDNG